MPTKEHEDLTDPYARLGERVRRRILPYTLGNPTPDRLMAILKAAVRALDQIPQSPLKDVVYVVLNHPPLMSATNDSERHFVAAINGTNVAPQTVQYLQELTRTRETTEAPTGCKVWLFHADGLSALEDAVQRFWSKTWGQYLAITHDGVKQNKYTWNQLLLKDAAHPFPLGLYWKEHRAADIAAPYFRLTPALAADIGLPNPDSPEWLPSLLRDVDLSPPALNCYYDSLDPLLRLFDEIDRAGEDMRKPADVAWAIYHLIRKYAVWGGNAFLSVPILIGAETHRIWRTAVLSICTVKPLDVLAYREWKIIAGVLLRPLVEEEMGDMINKLQFAHAAYDLAHFIKNRQMPLSYALDTLENQLSFSGLPRNELHRYLQTVRGCWKRLTDGSHILDVHAHAIETRRKEGVFLQGGKKGEWTTSGRVYDVRGALTQFCKHPRPQNVSQAMTLEFLVDGQIVVAADWIEGSCRPSDTIYDGIVEELVINAARHSNVDPVQLRVDCVPAKTVSGGMPVNNSLALVVSNFCSSPAALTKLELTQGKWHRWKSHGHGGMPHFSRFLEASNLSDGLFVRIDPETDNALGIDGIRFSVAIPFNGLQIGDPRSTNDQDKV